MYDHISFHIEEQPSLSDVQAALHMGYYYAWAVSQNLHSVAAEALPLFGALRHGEISGAEFVVQQLNGGIDETCFNELGNRFTQYYYADDDEGYGHFMDDYFVTLGLQTEAEFYRQTWQPAHQKQLNAVFQAAFDKWKSSLKS